MLQLRRDRNITWTSDKLWVLEPLWTPPFVPEQWCCTVIRLVFSSWYTLAFRAQWELQMGRLKPKARQQRRRMRILCLD